MSYPAIVYLLILLFLTAHGRQHKMLMPCKIRPGTNSIFKLDKTQHSMKLQRASSDFNWFYTLSHSLFFFFYLNVNSSSLFISSEKSNNLIILVWLVLLGSSGEGVGEDGNVELNFSNGRGMTSQSETENPTD